MKKYVVTVNGNRYEVEVEEVKGDFSESAITKTDVNEPKKIENKSKNKENVNVKGEKIESPMPGKILKVNVSEGQTIKKGEVLFILEAMKMENEVMAPTDGKMVKISISEGASVNTGDILGVIQ